MAAEGSFDDLIHAIQNAFIKVNHMAETQHIDMLKNYLDDENNPICIDFNYPYTNSLGELENRRLSIPKLCLIPIQSLKLSEVSVDFKVKLSGKINLKRKDEEEGKKQLLRSSFHNKKEDTSFLGYVPVGGKRTDSSYANIVIKFTSEEAPEGMMRIQDELIKVSI